MTGQKTRVVSYVSNAETDQISRVILAWLNQYPEKPVNLINFEFLDDTVSMALSSIQGAYKIRQYIGGGYQAQYQFKIIYRLFPSGPSGNDDRLRAEELLNAMGDWLAENKESLILGENIVVQRIQTNARASLFGRYEDGSEDHQILMTIIYEVI